MGVLCVIWNTYFFLVGTFTSPYGSESRTLFFQMQSRMSSSAIAIIMNTTNMIWHY